MQRDAIASTVHVVGDVEFADGDVDDDVLRCFVALVEELQAIDAGEDELRTALVAGAARMVAADAAWLTSVDPRRPSAETVVAAWGMRAAGPIGAPGGSGAGMRSLRRVLSLSDADAYLSPGVAEQLRGEGFAGLAVAPLAERATLSGCLYVARRRPGTFTAFQCQALGRLVEHASLALQRGAAFRALDARRARLRRWLELHGEMSAVTVRGIGVEGVLEMVASLLGRPTALDVAPHALGDAARWVGGEQPERTGPSVSWPVLVGGDEIGTLHALGDGPLSEIQIGILRYGARLIAIEVLKVRGAADSEADLRSALLEKLIDGGDRDDPAIATRAARLNVRLDVPRRLFAFSSPGDSRETGLLEVARRCADIATAGSVAGTLTARLDGSVLVALAEDAPGSEGFVDDVRSRMRARGAMVTSAIARPAADLSVAAHEALACLALAARAPRAGATVDAGTLGALYFLLDAPSLDDAAQLVEADLGALLVYDRTARVPLQPTLESWLSADGHTAAAARTCGVHPSTLKYRIGRLQGVLGVSLSDRDVRLRLGLALELRRFLATLGISVMDDAPAGPGRELRGS
jgi:sugar diacid utilization regulator